LKKTTLLSVLYFLIGIIFIASEGHIQSRLLLLIKALIIPVLIIIFIINLKRNLNRLSNMMLAGLLLSWAGDVILELSFIPGLACFLVAHVMYLSVFLLTPGENILFRRSYLLIPVALYGAGLILYLNNDLEEMRIPVILYAIIILTMLGTAINRLMKVNKPSYWLVLAGAILFVLSDSAIAVNKFTLPFKFSGILIMSTYVIAQYLIIKGYIRQFSIDLE
jgi:uncharacterized membrane protein YhhN